jgi:hypothetical protein
MTPSTSLANKAMDDTLKAVEMQKVQLAEKKAKSAAQGGGKKGGKPEVAKKKNKQQDTPALQAPTPAPTPAGKRARVGTTPSGP